MSYPSEQYYESKWKAIVNVMKSQNLGVSRIAKAGSRAKRQQKPESDMDIIFAVSGNPSRTTFYAKLIEVLKKNFPGESVYLGASGNIVHLNFRAGGKFELVLLSESQFDREHQNILQYKRDNL